MSLMLLYNPRRTLNMWEHSGNQRRICWSSCGGALTEYLCLEETLPMAGNLVDNSFEIYSFWYGCLKLCHEMKAAMATQMWWIRTCRRRQNKSKSFFSSSSFLCFTAPASLPLAIVLSPFIQQHRRHFNKHEHECCYVWNHKCTSYRIVW